MRARGVERETSPNAQMSVEHSSDETVSDDAVSDETLSDERENYAPEGYAPGDDERPAGQRFREARTPDDCRNVDIALFIERIRELGQILAVAKGELATLSASSPGTTETGNPYIPLANQELNAIAVHTAAATNEILDACELIDPLSKKLNATDAAQILSNTMRIYTACGFQDLVGQRIRKILQALVAIDRKIELMIEAFGRADPLSSPPTESSAGPLSIGPASGPVWVHSSTIAPRSKEDLMNGPQLPSSAMTQSDIDRLLAGE